MGRPCDCCNGSTDPAEACDASGETIPAHPSSPSARVLIAGQSLTTETLAVGCSITATIGDSTIGRHPFEISITSQQPLWHGFAIAWLNHDDLPLDPHLIGSLGFLAAGCSLRISDVSGWDVTERELSVSDRSGPWLIPTLVVEQAGRLFLAYRRRLLDLTLAAPCCWRGISASAIDAGEVDRMTRSVFDADRSRTDIESVVSGNGSQCSDAFGVLRPDGTLNRDDRPDFNLGLTPHPITRVGFAIGFSSCPSDVVQSDWSGEGTFKMAGLLGPICGSIQSYGSYYTAGTALAPEPPGALVIDETLENVPAWSTGDLLVDDGMIGGFHPEGAAAGAVFTARDGATFVENVGLSEYPSGTLYTELPRTRDEWVDGSRLTLEFTWRRVRDADRRYDLPGTPDPFEYRNQTNGVFVGGLLRFLLRHENAARYDELLINNGGLNPRYGWLATAPVHGFGGSISADLDYTTWPNEWAYDPPAPGRPWPTLPQGAAWQVAGEAAFDVRGQRFIAANDGDRVGIVLTCSRPTIPNPYTAATDDTISDWLWTPQIWVNGRKIGGITANSGVLNNFRAVPPASTLRIGLAAYYGGGWSDFKAWLS